MERIRSDAPGPRQDMAIEIIGLANTLYKQGNTLTIKWVPDHRGSVDNEEADAYARDAAGRIPEKDSRRAAERISASFLKRRAAELHAAGRRIRRPGKGEENLPALRAQVQTND